MKGYTAFNVEQHAERFFGATGADFRHGGNQAYYSVTDDYVQLDTRKNLPSTVAV